MTVAKDLCEKRYKSLFMLVSSTYGCRWEMLLSNYQHKVMSEMSAGSVIAASMKNYVTLTFKCSVFILSVRNVASSDQ